MRSYRFSLPLILFLFLLSVYMLTASGRMDSRDTEVRMAISRGLLEKGELAVDPSSVSEYARKSLVQGRGGRWYSCYGLGQSVLMIPPSLLGYVYFARVEPATLLNAIVVALAGVVLFLFLVDLAHSRSTALLLSLAFGLGTMAWPYSKTTHEAPLELLFILSSFWLIGRYQLRQSPKWLIYSGFSLGMAILIRPTAVIAAPSLLLYLTISDRKDWRSGRVLVRKISIWGFSILPFLAAVFWYNYYRFGSVMETGHTADASFGWFFSTPMTVGLRGLLLSPGKSFFLYSPITILFIPTVLSFFRKRRAEALSFSLLILTYLLFHAKLRCWHGDWAWGPRYLLVLIPFTLIPIAGVLKDNPRPSLKIMRWSAILLFSIGLLIQIAAVSVDYHWYFYETGLADYEKVAGKEFFYLTTRPYFDWRYSPILYQFRYAVDAVKGVGERVAFEGAKSGAIPHSPLFDFWWVYGYPLGMKSWIMVGVSLLTGLMILSGRALLKEARRVADG